MKTNALLAFFFAAALSALTTAEFVYDSNGEILTNGGIYNLSAAYPLGGPSIKGAIIKKGENTYSLAVVGKFYEEGWSTRIGAPLGERYITTELFLRIEFDPLPSNNITKNGRWQVITEKGFGTPVMVGDANEFPIPVSGWFFIKPYDSEKHHYKLVFSSEQDKWVHVGLKTDSHGNNRLIVTEDPKTEPLVFKFVKAKASGISMVV